jgi:hypothetical protein
MIPQTLPCNRFRRTRTCLVANPCRGSPASASKFDIVPAFQAKQIYGLAQSLDGYACWAHDLAQARAALLVNAANLLGPKRPASRARQIRRPWASVSGVSSSDLAQNTTGG